MLFGSGLRDSQGFSDPTVPWESPILTALGWVTKMLEVALGVLKRVLGIGGGDKK